MALDNIFVLKKKEIIMIKPFFGVLYFLKIISSYKTLLILIFFHIISKYNIIAKHHEKNVGRFKEQT